MGTLVCHLSGVAQVEEVEDVGAFWFVQTKSGTLLSYRTRTQPKRFGNRPGVKYVVPQDPNGWALFGPAGRPWCGIDQSKTLEDLEL